MHDLFREIEHFRHWAQKTEHSGEWETRYTGWPLILDLFDNYIQCTSFSDWDSAAISDILYIIARDNEVEYLIDLVAKQDALLIFLAERAVESGEQDAKWQIASRLGLCGDRDKAIALLAQFFEDESEYVSRRALLALAELNTSETE